MAFSKQELDTLLFADQAVLIVHSDAFDEDVLDALALRVEDDDPDLQAIWAPLTPNAQNPNTATDTETRQVTPQGSLRSAPRSVAEYKLAIKHLNLRAILFLGCIPSAAALVAAHSMNIPVAAAHLKRSDIPKQRRFWALAPKMLRLRNLDMIFTVDPAKAIAHDLHIPETLVRHCADLRFSRPAEPVPLEHYETLHPKLMHRSIWAATHVTRGDMRHILTAHREILRRDFRALLIIAPRDQADYIACKAYIHEAQLSFRCTSEAHCPDDQTHIFLDDTGMPSALWHHLAQSSVVGGSFDDVALPADITPIIGHGSAVIYGPKLGSFQSNVTELVRLRAARQVSNASTLAHAVMELSNVDTAAAQTVAAWDYATQADATLSEIAQWLIAPYAAQSRPLLIKRQDSRDEDTQTLVS